MSSTYTMQKHARLAPRPISPYRRHTLEIGGKARVRSSATCFAPSVSLSMGVPDSFEPLKHNRLSVAARLLHNQCGDLMEGLIHAFFLSSRACELLLETPIVWMPLVELGAPNAIEGVQSGYLRDVIFGPVTSYDRLFVEVVTDLSR